VKPLQVIPGGIEKPQSAGCLKTDRRGIRQFIPELFVSLDDIILLAIENTIEASQHNEGQNHIAVFVLFERPPQNIVCDLPYKVGFVLEVVH
jgi:hypothetical protein